MLSVTKHFHFAAAHRLLDYDGPCSQLHGHNWEVEITVGGPQDSIGMVVDFGDLKDVAGVWLDETFDHKTLAWDADLALVAACQELETPCQLLPFQSTAENLACFILEELPPVLRAKGLPEGVVVHKVVVVESPGSVAQVVAW